MPFPAPQTPPQRPLTDDDARRLCAALAPLQALDADSRSVGCAPATPSGTRDPDAARGAQVDSGAITRARVASRRLALVPLNAAEVLREVVQVAHALTSASQLARRVGETVRRDVALEESLAAAKAAAEAAEEERKDMQKELDGYVRASGPLSRVALHTRRVRDGAIVRRDNALARVAQAEAALAARGWPMLAAALAAWDATEVEE